MREIKFRAWDAEERRFDSRVYLSVSIDETIVTIRGVDRAVIEQYTGLKDKNGREIYEGDIVKYTCTTPWNESGVSVVEYDQESTAFEPFIGVDGPECEVIGNIHENADLLEAPNA